MPDPADYAHLAALAGLAPDHPLVQLAAAEHARLMRKLGGEATEHEAWLVAIAVQYRVELEAALQQMRVINAREPCSRL